MLLALVIVAARCFWFTGTKRDSLKCFQSSMKLYLESGAAEAVRRAIVEAFHGFQYEEAQKDEYKSRLLGIIHKHQMGVPELLFHCLLQQLIIPAVGVDSETSQMG